MAAFLPRRVVWPGLTASLAALAFAFPLRASDLNPVIVHEWGTFTSLQDQDAYFAGRDEQPGATVEGINVDDEPVPYFVYTDGLRQVIAQKESDFGITPNFIGKVGTALSADDPAVTLRLETPVLYIYPPKGETPQSVPHLSVHVDFHGGILSQFYPRAKFEGLATFQGTNFHHGALNAATTTSLTWSNIQLGSKLKPIDTDDHVWTTPRETSAPILETSTPTVDSDGHRQDNRAAEHFLFYRGVGHLDSPFKIGRAESEGNRAISSAQPGAIDQCWMAEIRPDGTCAFHTAFDEHTLPGDSSRHELASMNGEKIAQWGISDRFADTDFSHDNLAQLQASMQTALVKQGLYPDEASAMLRTWQLSYFKSPGLRFFYTVPRAWTDTVLPLKVAGAPVKITRVMVGRIELISDRQKAELKRLAAGPPPDFTAVKTAARLALQSNKYSDATRHAFYRGDLPLRELGIPIPPLAQDYLDLGRFRDVLVLHEQKARPTPALAQFIQQNHLEESPTPDDKEPVGTTASN